MDKLFKDEIYMNQEIGRIRQQIQKSDNTVSDWEVIFRTLGFALFNVPEDRTWLIQATLNEAHTRHSFWMQKKGMGVGTLAPLI